MLASCALTLVAKTAHATNRIVQRGALGSGMHASRRKIFIRAIEHFLIEVHYARTNSRRYTRISLRIHSDAQIQLFSCDGLRPRRRELGGWRFRRWSDRRESRSSTAGGSEQINTDSGRCDRRWPTRNHRLASVRRPRESAGRRRWSRGVGCAVLHVGCGGMSVHLHSKHRALPSRVARETTRHENEGGEQ